MTHRTSYLLAIDQGTTSTRAVAFTLDGMPAATHQVPFKQIYPRDGWVEHDAEEIWSTVEACVNAVVAEIGGVDQVAALGITNQRETTVVWDRATGAPVSHAIVWQDRRGAEICEALRNSEQEEIIQSRTGLIPDSYFSATKIQWLLDSQPGLRDCAARGDLACGTIDSFLLWRLTGGVHATDATNASRTMIFDIHRQDWDDELLGLFAIPKEILPSVCDSAHPFGETEATLFGARIPVTALVGDQQGALAGQTCFDEGMAKSTFGTGAFVLVNTGRAAPTSKHRLLTTVAYRLNGQTTYSVEGSVFNAGTTVQWMRDELELFEFAHDTHALAEQSARDSVIFIPAFTGLGAPHWEPDARGGIFGLTRDTTKADVVRAGLESVCFQTADLLDAMTSDSGQPLSLLRVDGGMAANDLMMQMLSDITGIPVERPCYLETTVLGAALMAGIGAGVYSSVAELSGLRNVDRLFEPRQSEDWRQARRARWHDAVKRILSR